MEEFSSKLQVLKTKNMANFASYLIDIQETEIDKKAVERFLQTQNFEGDIF